MGNSSVFILSEMMLVLIRGEFAESAHLSDAIDRIVQELAEIS